MRVKRLLIGSALALTCSLAAGAAAASAHEGHGSCAAFGAESADLAGALGELASGLATSGAGALAAVVADEHGSFCVSAP